MASKWACQHQSAGSVANCARHVREQPLVEEFTNGAGADASLLDVCLDHPEKLVDAARDLRE